MGKRLDEIRFRRGIDCKQFAKELGMVHSTVTRVCNGVNGMTLRLLLQMSQHLTEWETDFIQFGTTIPPERMQKEIKTKTREDEKYTDAEHEIIKLLRKMPEFRKKILDSLQIKLRLKADFQDFMLTP